MVPHATLAAGPELAPKPGITKAQVLQVWRLCPIVDERVKPMHWRCRRNRHLPPVFLAILA